MIVIPEKVAFIKVPKAASTTIARLFWDSHRTKQIGQLEPKVATTIQYFMTLEQVGQNIPILNGNWFFNRSGAFGWHASYDDLLHLFGKQLDDYLWVSSVRHPVARLFSAFSFQIAKGRISASLCAADFEKFCFMVFSDSTHLNLQQRIHTWPQSAWLPPVDANIQLSIIRQERLREDLQRLSERVPSFSTIEIGHDGKSFEGQWQEYVSEDLRRRIEDHYAEDMDRFGYRKLVAQESRVAK